jgi:hypothetical protein
MMEIGTEPGTWHPDIPTEPGYYWVSWMLDGRWFDPFVAELAEGVWTATGVEIEQDPSRWYFSDRLVAPLTPDQRTPEEQAEFTRIVDETMARNAELYRRLADL